MAAQSDNTKENKNSNGNDSVTTDKPSQKKRTSLKRAFDADYEQLPPTKYLKVAVSAPVLKVKKLSENAKLPIRGSEHAAGFDLHAAADAEIPPNGKALVKTDIAVAVPVGCYGRVAPRSGLAWKHHIDIGAGVIDSDYRGNVGVVMFNHSAAAFKVEKHMRIAQLILERYEHRATLMECDDLDDTMRGVGGFGSTGVKAVKGKDAEPESKESADGKAKASESGSEVAKDGPAKDKAESKIVAPSASLDKAKAAETNGDNEQKDAEMPNAGASTNVAA